MAKKTAQPKHFFSHPSLLILGIATIGVLPVLILMARKHLKSKI